MFIFFISVDKHVLFKKMDMRMDFTLSVLVLLFGKYITFAMKSTIFTCKIITVSVGVEDWAETQRHLVKFKKKS